MAIQFRDRTIDDFKGRLVGGGARSNLFEVELPLIEGAATDNKSVEDLMRFMIKATSLLLYQQFQFLLEEDNFTLQVTEHLMIGQLLSLMTLIFLFVLPLKNG